MGLLGTIGRWLATFLNAPSRSPHAPVPTDLRLLKQTIRKGDVLLVEGQQRISTAIKYLTQSTWSHAALCIAADGNGVDGAVRLIEADPVEGVRIVPLERYADHHTRICRPVGLSEQDIDQLVRHALAHEGDQYDLANVVDLARYLLPTPPVPTRWRRRMIALGSGEPTKAICSTLIAQAFQSIRYPILPAVSREMIKDPNGRERFEEILHIRHYSLFTPRDFDVSPYFAIVKPTIAAGFDHRKLAWANRLPPSAQGKARGHPPTPRPKAASAPERSAAADL